LRPALPGLRGSTHRPGALLLGWAALAAAALLLRSGPWRLAPTPGRLLAAAAVLVLGGLAARRLRPGSEGQACWLRLLRGPLRLLLPIALCAWLGFSLLLALLNGPLALKAAAFSGLAALLVAASLGARALDALEARRERLLVVALVPLSTVLALAGGELALRVTWPVPAHLDRLAYPDLYQTNARGFRGPEFGPRGADPRIIVLGDSFTFGLGVREPDHVYPRLLERRLREAGHPVEVLNLGIPGSNTRDEAALMESVGWGLDPDVVVLGFVLNDPEPRGRPPADGSSLGLLLARYRLGLLALRAIQSFSQDSPATYQARERASWEEDSDGWRGLLDGLQRLASQARQRRVRLVLVILPAVADWEHYPFLDRHAQIARAATALGLPVLDLLPALGEAQRQGLDWRTTDFGDGHPTAPVHAIYAQGIARWLDQAGWLTR
jgi:lysophospholipase L1-like esterase